jgi:hypothetical protein
LALSYLPGLVYETYRQGLSVLEDALELARATSAPRDLRLKAEIKDLEDKIRAAGESGKEEEARVKLWQERLDGGRQRLEMIDQMRLRLAELFQQARKCEAALHQTRVELAALKGDDWTVSVAAVLERLQKTMKQAQAVQDELRKLGY